jgi:hypothetical protein
MTGSSGACDRQQKALHAWIEYDPGMFVLVKAQRL